MLIVISCSHSKLPFQFFQNPLLLCNAQSRSNILVLNYVSSSVISFMSKNYISLVGMHNLGQHCSDDSATGNLVLLNSYVLTPVMPIQAGSNCYRLAEKQ